MLFDTSALIKWFHDDGESESEQAQWHLLAHREGLVDAHVLDLGIYELGNVLIRALGRDATHTATVIDATLALCGPALTLSHNGYALAATIADTAGLSFYDASFVAAAREHGMTLLSADRRLVATGNALTLTQSQALLRQPMLG